MRPSDVDPSSQESAIALQPPVIVIPGITGSSLVDRYPVEPQELWSALLHKEYLRVALHPEDPRYEAVEPARVQAGNVFGLVYEDLVRALRHELSPREDEPTPVFPFPYDWRQPLERLGEELAAMVEEVIARTRLLRHYKGYGEAPRVDLVGHSVGGLVICEYLAAHGARKRVRKVATLGTPFRGSVEAVVKLATGLGSLTGDAPSEREREGARSVPSIYQLLPSYAGAAAEADLFDADVWQESVVESLAEQLRLHAVEPGRASQRRARARGSLEGFLGAGRAHRARVERLSLRRAGLAPEDWLAVAGAARPTRLEVGVRRPRGRPRFELRGAPIDEGAGSLRTGDGTVAVASAIPPFLGAERVVGVVPDDFELFELRDRVVMGRAGFHALLPNLNLAQRLVVRQLRRGFRGEVWGRPVAGISPGAWSPPFRIPRV